jgi:hypothetical protein
MIFLWFTLAVGSARIRYEYVSKGKWMISDAIKIFLLNEIWFPLAMIWGAINWNSYFKH